MTVYLTLFLTALAAATVLPFYSEFLVVGLILDGKPAWPVWFWATLGNTLGSVVNYVLARYLLHFRDRKWFPMREERLGKAQAWFNRYGQASLLLAWAPVGGDALTYIGGLMAVPFRNFLLLVATGKGLRYAFIIWALNPDA